MSSVEVGGVAIGYRTQGDPAGPPVVLLHGGSSGAATWGRLSAALAATGHRTIAADLRGHGGSSRTAEYPLTGFRAPHRGLASLRQLCIADVSRPPRTFRLEFARWSSAARTGLPQASDHDWSLNGFLVSSLAMRSCSSSPTQCRFRLGQAA